MICFIYSKYSVTAVPSLKVHVPKYDSMKAYKRGGKIHAFLTTSMHHIFHPNCIIFDHRRGFIAEIMYKINDEEMGETCGTYGGKEE